MESFHQSMRSCRTNVLVVPSVLRTREEFVGLWYEEFSSAWHVSPSILVRMQIFFVLVVTVCLRRCSGIVRSCEALHTFSVVHQPQPLSAAAAVAAGEIR